MDIDKPFTYKLMADFAAMFALEKPIWKRVLLPIVVCCLYVIVVLLGSVYLFVTAGMIAFGDGLTRDAWQIAYVFLGVTALAVLHVWMRDGKIDGLAVLNTFLSVLGDIGDATIEVAAFMVAISIIFGIGFGFAVTAMPILYGVAPLSEPEALAFLEAHVLVIFQLLCGISLGFSIVNGLIRYLASTSAFDDEEDLTEDVAIIKTEV